MVRLRSFLLHCRHLPSRFITRLPAVPALPETVDVPLRTTGIATFLCAMPVLFVLAPTPTGLLSPAVALWWLGLNRRALRGALGRAVVSQLVLLLGLWGLLGWFWATRPAVAATDAALFMLEVLPLSLMAHVLAQEGGQHRRLKQAFIIGLALAAVLLAVQIKFDFLLRSLLPGADQPVAGIKLNVPTAALAILCWVGLAAGGGLAARWQALGLLGLLLTGWSAFAGVGSAPRLACVVGAGVYGMAWVAPRLTAWGIALGCGVMHAASPFLGTLSWVTEQLGDYSWRHRLDVWALTGQLIAERPLLGYGFLNSDAAPFSPYIMPLTHHPADMPSYPHNVLLQVQLEQGLPGVVLFYTALGYLLCRALRHAAPARAAGLAALAAALGVWLVGYPFSRGHWVGWLCFVAVAYTATTASTSRCVSA